MTIGFLKKPSDWHNKEIVSEIYRKPLKYLDMLGSSLWLVELFNLIFH